MARTLFFRMVFRKFSEITKSKPSFSQYNIFYNYEFFTILWITFLSLRFDLFSIIAKEVNRIRNNIICVAARLEKSTVISVVITLFPFSNHTVIIQFSSVLFYFFIIIIIIIIFHFLFLFFLLLSFFLSLLLFFHINLFVFKFKFLKLKFIFRCTVLSI